MTYKGDPIAEKLDKLAEATGVPKMQRNSVAREPVRFRLVPMALLVIGVIGLGLQIANPWGFGLWLIMMAWVATTMIYAFGPLGRRPMRKMDEREAAVARHGHFIGLIAAFTVAVLGSFAFAFAKIGAMLRLWDFWAPASGLDWMAITLFLLLLEANVAIIAATSATPEPLEDEE